MKNKLIGNLLVTGAGRFGGMVIQLLVTIVLSRFLAPEDFGIVAMCSIFLSISEMLVDSGMAGSIMFYDDVEEIELHTLFWTNFFISIIIYLVLFFTAPAIASFYNTPILETIIKVIALSTVIHSLSIIQYAIMSKNLEFKVQSKIMVLSSVFSSVIVIFLGVYGYGIWALVAQPVLLKLFLVFFYFKMGNYKPRFQYSLNSLKRHWIFGSRLLGVSFMKMIYENLYVQVIGKTVNLRDAGYYAQAKRFNDIPTNLLIFPLDKVIFPTLAKSDNKMQQMDKMTLAFAYVVIPLLLLGALISKEAIVILLGLKWLDSGWMLSFMFIGTIGAAFEVLNRCFIKATGETGILLKYDFAKRAVNIAVLCVGAYWSIKGFLIAFIINGVIGWLFNCVALSKAIGYNIKKQVKDVAVVTCMALLPYFAITYVSSTFSLNVWVAIITKTICYLFLYTVVLYTVKREEMVNLLKTIKAGKK